MPLGKLVPNPANTSMTVKTGLFRGAVNKAFGTQWRSKEIYYMSPAKAAPFFEKGAATAKTKRKIHVTEGKEPGSPHIKKPLKTNPKPEKWPHNPNHGGWKPWL
jgi:hypothetical protein